MRYKNLFSDHPKHSCLPPSCQRALRAVRQALRNEAVCPQAVAIPYLCLQSETWLRRDQDRAAYDKVEASPEVAAYMAQHLRAGRQGPLPRQCRAMLRHNAFDAHLPDLARTAATPNVRAIALGALLSQKASWISGWQKRWVDKSYGISKMDAVWTHRPIAVPVDTPALVCFGAKSRAVAVRRTVAYWLLTTAKSCPEAVALLSQDRYPSIRKAMDYYKRKQAKNA